MQHIDACVEHLVPLACRQTQDEANSGDHFPWHRLLMPFQVPECHCDLCGLLPEGRYAAGLRGGCSGAVEEEVGGEGFLKDRLGATTEKIGAGRCTGRKAHGLEGKLMDRRVWNAGLCYEAAEIEQTQIAICL
eukprot:657688-Pelagomonas_calceolata.AAC.6